MCRYLKKTRDIKIPISYQNTKDGIQRRYLKNSVFRFT